MEKMFKIGSSRKYSEEYLFPKNTTATVVWEYVILNGEEFFAGAVYTDGEYLAASMCAPVGEFNFCQALLRKAYATKKSRPEREKFWEGVNIYGRKLRKCDNPSWWKLIKVEESANEPIYEWVCKPNPSVMYSTSRR